ncbi:MAG TPA: hypothetical protein VMU34_16400 [Mycobacterium sp.]|nr:hypothetical protein [Mycobacterium sp.]
MLREVRLPEGPGYLRGIHADTSVGLLDARTRQRPPAPADDVLAGDSAHLAIHACFWFERKGIGHIIERLGHHHLMFETDFPIRPAPTPTGLTSLLQAR